MSRLVFHHMRVSAQAAAHRRQQRDLIAVGNRRRSWSELVVPRQDNTVTQRADSGVSRCVMMKHVSHAAAFRQFQALLGTAQNFL